MKMKFHFVIGKLDVFWMNKKQILMNAYRSLLKFCKLKFLK